MSLLTHDSISLRGAGIVTIAQNRKGARFTLDSILLADFCRIKRNARILEPGTGTGIISILLAKKFPHANITAVEVQPSLAAWAGKNIVDNNAAHAVTLLHEDIVRLRKVLYAGTFDVIVANPPYTSLGTGRKSPLRERQMSRQDNAAGIGTWLDLQTVLKNGGRYFLIYPAARSAELITQLTSRKLEPKRIRLVHPHPDQPASLIMLEAVKEARAGVQVLPPLFVHGPRGEYSEEMRNIYSPSE